MPDKEMSDAEWARRLASNFKRNKAYSKVAANYQTQLNPATEAKFREWVKANKIPFNPDAKVSDYDMRGFWVALQLQNPLATSAIDPNDKNLHYPDYWKTPYHETFSNQSQWALPGAPSWNKLDQLVLPSGAVVYDDRKANAPISAAAPLSNPQ